MVVRPAPLPNVEVRRKQDGADGTYDIEEIFPPLASPAKRLQRFQLGML